MDIINKMSRKTDPRSVLYRRNRWLELDSPILVFTEVLKKIAIRYKVSM